MSELKELARDYDAGKFDGVRKDLEEFIRRHRADIVKMAADLRKLPTVSAPEALAIKLFIQQIKSVNPTDEIKTQLQEIEREVWYRGEKAGQAVDKAEVAREWCSRHAPGWRDHRITAIVYVFERNTEEFVRLLDPDGAPEASPSR